MDIPKLDNVVDTFFPVRGNTLEVYVSQLREELIPHIRKFQQDKSIIWFCFLLHDRTNISRKVAPEVTEPFVHIRLGLPEDADAKSFIEGLPVHFLDPIEKQLGEINGVDASFMNGDWAKAWWLVGEASDWVLKLLEAHADSPSVPLHQVAQFMHYISNPLAIGHKCLLLPGGFMRF